MENEYGSDFMTIVDEDGTEYELEVLSSLDYNGYTYLAVIPAGGEDDEEFQNPVDLMFEALEKKKPNHFSFINTFSRTRRLITNSLTTTSNPMK